MFLGEKFRFLVSLSPLFYLLFFVLFFRLIFDSDPLYGTHQASLFLAGLLALLQRIHKHHLRSVLTLAIRRNFDSVFPAMVILFFVGMLIGSWACAGILGSMISLGIKFLFADAFLPGVAILCGITAVVSGSSWTTAGTIGIALMGVGKILGFSPEICAGAVISGCYFGDKLSPLSDTTNLASSLTGVPLYAHIFHMLKTTIPSFCLCIVFYTLWNLFDSKNLVPVSISTDQIKSYDFLSTNPWNFLPVLLVFGSSLFRVRAIYSLCLGIVSAILLAHYQGQNFNVMMKSLFFGFFPSSGNPSLDAIQSGGGIIAILPTEFLILTAVWFGGILEGMGYLAEILAFFKRWIQVKWDILYAAMGSSLILNLTTADQYLSLVVPARAFRNLAKEYNVEPKDISRSLEDSGTVSSPLIPWNSCGAFMATSLKVSTFAYLPFVWFNLIHIVYSIVVIQMRRKKIT